jgi:hypothetical protein
MDISLGIFKVFKRGGVRGETVSTLEENRNWKIFTFAPCMLLHSLYLKPTYALISKHTFTFTVIKTLKLVKNIL